jgi:8-oxo-dGTP diphosphatase
MAMKLQVGVKALIKNDQGKYLLLKRAQAMTNEIEPHWDIPGGRIEPEESLHDALQREIAEETGLTLSALPRLLEAQDIFVTAADLHVVRLTYEMDGAGEATFSDEHQEAAWMTLDEAKQVNLDPYLRKVLEK